MLTVPFSSFMIEAANSAIKGRSMKFFKLCPSKTNDYSVILYSK